LKLKPLNTLEGGGHLNNIEEFSFYLTGNTVLHHEKNSRLILCKEITAVYSENNMKPINMLCSQNAKFF
jgi:hypothetical protein